jgi:hypothetical protein
VLLNSSRNLLAPEPLLTPRLHGICETSSADPILLESQARFQLLLGEAEGLSTGPDESADPHRVPITLVNIAAGRD